MEVLFEPIHCGPKLYVFGAGHVGQAVCKTLERTPFTVHAIDDRSEWIDSPLLPSETIRHKTESDDFIRSAHWDPIKTYAVVMTHRHDHDQEIIESLLDRPARYIGLIGSRGKWERFKQRFTLKGIPPKS